MRPTRSSSTARLAAPLAVLVTALVAAPGAARAQECAADAGTGLPADVGYLASQFPSAGALGVPIDGFIRLQYRVRVPPMPTVLVSVARDADAGSGSGEPVEGTAHVVGANEVHWQSARPLRPATRYVVQHSDLRGGASGSSFEFTTGSERSSSLPPRFDGLTAHRFQRYGMGDLCGDPDAVEVQLTWRRAENNGWPAEDIEYVVYQTAGPGIAGPVERARERQGQNATSCGNVNEMCRSFRLSSANASGPVCFVVKAFDAYGREDTNTNPRAERCFNPSVGNYFNGCSASPAPPARSGTRPWLAVLAVVALACALVGLARGRWRPPRS